MKTEEHIETVLRRAPAPQPPANLKQTLIDEVSLPGRSPADQGSRAAFGAQSWLARWWPALGAGATSLACAVLVGVQEMTIQDLRESVQALSTQGAVSAPAPDGASSLLNQGTVTPEQEIERLRRLVVDLGQQVNNLERLAAENQELQTSLAKAPANFTPEEAAALENARQRALSITCVNNMKQLALATLLYANDNQEAFPADVTAMAKYINAPQLLWCPADTSRSAAADWGSVSAANCSYEYLMGDATAYREPNRVMFRCGVHGHVGIGDGSVHSGVAKEHPERLVTKDGKLFMEVSKSQPEGR